ncbi:MAG: polysaccharide pyruvyl transferase family protein [Rhizomicrobium sp.]
MRNFGDLMFPLIAGHRLSSPGVEIVPVSPTGAATGLAEAMNSIGLEELLTGETPASGILVGGGYIVHSHKMHFLDEYKAEGLANFAGPGLWLGATLAAAIRNVPVIWNAPGVPHPLARNQRGLIDAALRAADCLSVRDRGGLELLAPPEGLQADIVPDTVADIARMWSLQSLAAPFQSFISRKGGDPGARHLALHFRNRSLVKLGAEGAAALIDEFAQAHRLVPILIAIGQTHADDVVAREISRHLRERHIVLDDPIGLREIAAAIGCSSLYVGASLHGYVVAAAYGVPGVLVAQPSYRKFQGFLDHTGRNDDLARDWHQAFDTAAKRVEEGPAVRIPDSVFEKLDSHWNSVGEALASPERRSQQRHEFLQTWIRAGIGAGGPLWAHQPFVGRGTVRYSMGEP